MSPITHLMQRHAVQVECNPLTPPLYQIDNEWIGLVPHAVMKQAPAQLKVEDEEKLIFSPIQPLGSSDLYTQDEVSQVQKTLTFGLERLAVSNILARRIAGLHTDNQGFDALKLFDKEEMKSLARTTLRYVWGWFTELGMVMSGFIGIYVVLRIIRYTMEVMINGVAIYKAVGCGFAILASLWDTLAV